MPTTITTIPAAPGWFACMRDGDTWTEEPVIAWEICRDTSPLRNGELPDVIRFALPITGNPMGFDSDTGEWAVKTPAGIFYAPDGATYDAECNLNAHFDAMRGQQA